MKTKTQSKRIEFTLNSKNNFGIFSIKKKALKDISDPEQTFRNILKSLSQIDTKNWTSIEFMQDNIQFDIWRESLIETNFNFFESNHA